MRSLFLSFGIGIVAGVLDIVPMIAKRLNSKAVLSAFLQYVFVGVVICNIDLPGIVWWLEGGLTSLALSVPILVIVSDSDRKSVPIIAVNAILLGTLISVAAFFLGV